jgi:hypothetical protein
LIGVILGYIRHQLHDLDLISRFRAKCLQDLDPRHPGHLEVGENQIGEVSLYRGQQITSGLEGPD